MLRPGDYRGISKNHAKFMGSCVWVGGDILYFVSYAKIFLDFGVAADVYK